MISSVCTPAPSLPSLSDEQVEETMNIHLLLCTVLCQFWLSPMRGNAVQLQDNVESVKAFAESNTLFAFEEHVRRTAWHAPVIHSRWYVDRMTNANQRSQEQLSRDFGFVLVMKLNDIAAIVSTNQPFPVYERHAWMLIHLGKWLGMTDGYGNLLLGYRCFDIAFVSMARMVIDLSCPATNVEPLMACYDLSWYDTRVATDVLNDEAGVPMFGLPSRWQKVCRPRDNLARVWDHGSFICQTAYISPEAKQEEYIVFSAVERMLMQSNLSFFADSPGAGAETLERVWNLKRHALIIKRIPNEDTQYIDNKGRLRALLRFREAVGGFPSNVAGRTRHSQSIDFAIRDAFLAAWEKQPDTTNDIFDDEKRTTYAHAASLYARFVDGDLIDEDTKEAEDYKRLQMTLDSPARSIPSSNRPTVGDKSPQ